MRAIIGIGNPGSRYKNNRHNIGFQFLDYFAEKKTCTFQSSKFKYHFTEGELSGEPFVLVKPDTYVNLSGVAASNCINYYQIDVKDLLVIVDDISLDLYSVRIRKSGGDGGHNGLSSIIYHINSDNFPRIRFGIGNDFKLGALSDYVLSDFNENDIDQLRKSFDMGIYLADSFIAGGYQIMLNTFSRLKNFEKPNLKSE